LDRDDKQLKRLDSLPDFDPHSSRARGLGIWRWLSEYRATLDAYGREGACGDAVLELQNVSLSDAPPRGRVSVAGGSDRGVYPLLHKWYIRLTGRSLSVRAAGRPSAPPPPPPSGPLIRHSMGTAFRRLWEATALLEGDVSPSHMLTLTLPPAAWERLPSDDARLERWRSALDSFLLALKIRLRRRYGSSWGWLWWLEFQRRGAPHLHVLLDLGGRLPEDDWRDWGDWVSAAWSRALGVPAPYATRLESLRSPDFRYARAYASKPSQKAFPFPGTWGRSWGVAGRWLELLRAARRAPASTYTLGHDELLALFHLAADERWADASHPARLPEPVRTGFEHARASAQFALAYEWVEGIAPFLSSMWRVAATAAACLGVPPPLVTSDPNAVSTTHTSLRCRFFFPARLRDWMSEWLAVLMSELYGDSPTAVVGAY
jgi:hypothetical protein